MIAKICGFVIFVATACASFSGCSLVSSSTALKPTDPTYDTPKIISHIKSADITESSGIAASKCQKNILWTHNDSGDEALIYALNSAGENLGTWKVANAENIDWEDISAFRDAGGKCFIYIGEIGDNKLKRPEHAIYRIAEPVVTEQSRASSKKEPQITADAESLRFAYSDLNQDAETLLVHPKTGSIYVVTKRVTGPAGIYRIKPEFNRPEIQKAERIGELSVPAIPNGFLTGGDISPDGRRVIICDYTQAYEYLLPAGENDFEKIWTQAAESIDLGKRKGGEAVCYSIDGSSIFATSEGRGSPVIEVKRRPSK